MRLILLLSVFFLYLIIIPCRSLGLCLSHKLAIDRFLDELEFQDLKIIDIDFIRRKLDCINEHIHDSIVEISYKENSNYTLRRYKTAIEYFSEKVSNELKEAVDIHGDLLYEFDWEFQQINVEIVNRCPRSAIDKKYSRELSYYLGRGPYNKSILFLNQTDISNKEELIDKVTNLIQKRFESQTDVLEDTILLHKLGIELELINLIYFHFRKYVELDQLEKKLNRIVEMFHLLAKFELFLTGCFEYPFEISISNLINLTQDLESKDYSGIYLVVYPDSKREQEFCGSYNKVRSSKGTPQLDLGPVTSKEVDQKSPESDYDGEYSEYHSPSNSVVLVDKTRPKKPLSNRVKLLKESMQDLRFDPSEFNDNIAIGCVKAEVDIISPILSVELDKLKGQNASKDKLNKNITHKIPSPVFKDKKTNETRININEELKSYIKSKEVERFNKVIGASTNNSKLEILNTTRCFEFHHICMAVRHLDHEEMMELDQDLFPINVKLPFEKDSNLIWSVSESLVDNIGARRRLVEFVSEKIKDFESSINRLNTTPLMNTGEEESDKISFYRGKHGEILSILFALKDFINSNNSQEISEARLKFIENFVPLKKRASVKKFKFSYDSENEKMNKSYENNNNKQVTKLRSPLSNEKQVKRIHLPSCSYLWSLRSDEIISEPSLYDLCTRFITTLSVTKSVKSFNGNSYKFSQKVCSMIFEQPIHNILSINDFAWLTGFTLVRTVNFLTKRQNLPEEMLIDHKIALRALNHSLSQKPYNFHQACTQSLISQKSTIIYRNNISLHDIRPIMKISCAEYFGISLFLHEN